MEKQKEIKRLAEKIYESGVSLDGIDFAYGATWDSHFTRLALKLVNDGYRLCGGDNCPNYKHYQAECERCTKKMEIKKALEIGAIKQQAVREFAERLKDNCTFDGHRVALDKNKIDELVKEV